MNNSLLGQKIVFFDADCLLCNRSVNFLLKKDYKGRLKFASLQSDLADEVRQRYYTTSGLTDTVIFCDEARIYTKSDAALKIAGYLKLPYAAFSVFQVVPRSWRDWIYDIVARNRTGWFGKKYQCKVPDQALFSRIIS